MKVLAVILLGFQFGYAFENLLILRSMEGFLTKLLCASKDDGNALVWNIPLTSSDNWNHNFDFCTVTFPAEKCTTGNFYDCRFNPDKNCIWNINKWKFTDSLSNAMGPVLDNRWEGFREYDNFKNWNMLNQFIHVDKFSKTGSLVFSVRGSMDAHIVLCDKENYVNAFCYWIIIGGWKNTESVIRKCPIGIPSNYPLNGSDCFVKRDFNNESFVLSPDEWRHFILKWEDLNYTQIITLYNEKKIFLQYENKDPVLNNRNDYYLFFKSTQQILIRYHIYNYIYTNELNNILISQEKPLKSQSFCLELSIGLCANCTMNIRVTAFKGNIIQEKQSRTVKGYTAIHGLTTWQYVKINITFFFQDNDYLIIKIIPMIQNKSEQGFWAVGNIRECPSSDATKLNLIKYLHNVHYAYPSQHQIFCQKMSYESNEVVNAFNEVSEFTNNDFDCPNGTLCSMSCGDITPHFNSDCENTAICTTTGCTCYKGFTGDQCDERCTVNRYGYACKESCGQCLWESCNTVTGICPSSKCNNNERYYVSPYCKTAIDPLPPPTINFISKTGVNVYLIVKDEYKEEIIEYCFLIRDDRNVSKENECMYETIFPNATSLEADFKFLRPGTNYMISCNLRVGQDKVIVAGFPGNFTIPCDFNANFKIKTNDTHLTITNENLFDDNKGIDYSCPLNLYNLLVRRNNTEYTIRNDEQNNIYNGSLSVIPFTLKVEPATVYDVNISGNNTNILSKTILIEDREPSEVTEIKIIIPSIDEVYVEWKPPKWPNGKIVKYEVALMVNVYNGCKDYGLPFISRHNQLTFTTTTNIKFYNLAAYAEYIVAITAYNSKEGLKTQKVFVIGPTDIPKSTLSNLRLTNNLLSWDRPVDCSTIAGPINVTKLIFTGVSEAVRNQKIMKQTSRQTLNISSINFKSYEKYKVQIFPMRNFNGAYNKSTGVELIFFSPSKPPTSVRNLDIYESDYRIKTIFLRWQEPSPRNGELDYYNVYICYNNQYCPSEVASDTINVLANQSCRFWDDYVCSKIKLATDSKVTIRVTGYNKNVSSAGDSAIIYYNPYTFATKPELPNNFQIQNQDKGVVILNWSHPWRTNMPLAEFSIQVELIKSNLRRQNWEDEGHKFYSYKIIEYQREYEKRINLLSSTEYKISLQTVTIYRDKSKIRSSWIRTPNSIDFEKDKLTYTVESNTSILLKIPKILNDTVDSNMYIVVKGQNPCKNYSTLNEYLSELTNTKSNEIAWLAANFPANQYSETEFSLGDDQKYAKGTNCPLRPYYFYTIFVIVQVEETSRVLFLNSIRFVYIPKPYVIWPIYLFVTLLILFLAAFNLYRRRMKKRLTTNIFALNENAETNRSIEKVISASPIASEKRSSINQSTMENVSVMVNTTQNYDPTIMPIKVKDFEDYVKNAIKSGLLDQQYKFFPKGQTKPWDYGKLPQNKSKNRYGNLIAYDETRVVLKKLADDPFSDYINANYIKGYKKEKRYIATQGPKANTIIDFWRMIWQEEIFVICMLTNLVENGKTKCEQYWPDIGKKKKYGDVTVFNSTHSVFVDYTFSTLQVTCNDETRKVEHLHYTAWPDHGVPIYTHSVVTYLKKILAKQIGNGPMVVHCSAGIGRTGTIILCDICLRLAAAEGVIDVFSEMRSIRNGRANMVDNKQQYLFVHLVLIDCLISLPTSLPCNNVLTKKIKNLKKQLEIQFQRLEDTAWQTEALRSSVSQTFLSECNLAKNRYPELVSNKISRIFLKRYPPQDEESDYIAAIYVHGLQIHNQYLSSQLPLPSTFGDFWRMVAEFKVELIVVLQPPDPDDPTCCPLVPTNNEFKPTPYINVIAKELLETEYYVFRKLTLIDNSEKPTTEQPVTILTCKQWESGKNKDPPSPIALVTLWQAAGRIARIDSPTVVLCHDGVTGCGIYLALSFLLERMAIERECDVCLAIRTVKQFRPDFVRSIKDMEYLYDAALAYTEYFETYANFS